MKLINHNKKTLIITGINGQIGKNLATRLIKLNYNIIGIDINNNCSLKLVNYQKCNISNENEIDDFYKELKKNNIVPDILINNAGIGTYGNILTRKTSEIKKVTDTNLLGTINMIKYFYKYSKKNKKIKKIINVASIYGYVSPKFEIYDKNDPRYSSEIYCATKAGIINLTKYFAKNFSRKNIIVNSISPGGILNKKLQNKKFIQNYIKNVPLGRLANVKDIVGPIIFLCSDASNYINGHNLIVDGGLSC